tara:strand:+ start:47240 stop:47992 length:753 start_codon:yes stop_codon:yes gene_type:complete
VTLTKSAREVIIGLTLVVIFATVCYAVFGSVDYDADWSTFWDRRSTLFSGWLVTVAVSLVGLIIAASLAILLVAGQRAGSTVLRRFCQGYIELVRGTPLLVHVYIGFYILADAFQLTDRFWVGSIILAAFSAAYLAEIIRGGIESIASSQREASLAVGFTEFQTYRFVIIPQTVRRILPAVTGEFANLIKNSSLLSIISISEFTKEIRDAQSITYATFELYLPLALGYLLLTIPIALVARNLESRFAYES